jgi:hypothetical protein
MVEFDKVDAVRVERYKLYLRKSVMVAYTVGLKYQNPVRDPVELYLADVGSLKDAQPERNAVEDRWRVVRQDIMREILRALQGESRARLNELTKTYFQNRIYFSISSLQVSRDLKYALSKVPITVIYGENGKRHQWTQFKVEGKD